jgi:hypothetical protein
MLHELAWRLAVDLRALGLRLLSQAQLVSFQEAQHMGGIVGRQSGSSDEDGLEQRTIVILAKMTVERFETALVSQQPVTTTAFEEADLEPMILHPPAPRVVVLRGR